MKTETPLYRAGTLLTALVVASAGCAILGKKEKSAGAGAAGGGAVSAAAGHKTGSTVRGALVGAAVGGPAGVAIGRQMDKQAERLTRELPPGTRVSRVGEGIAVTFESGILFPVDSAKLKPEAHGNLRKLAESLQANGRTEVMIVGHTDAKGRHEHNEQLSVRRAVAAADYVASQGVARNRLRTIGKGETEPIAPNATEAERQQNRRVEVAIYADQKWRDEARRTARSR